MPFDNAKSLAKNAHGDEVICQGMTSNVRLFPLPGFLVLQPLDNLPLLLFLDTVCQTIELSRPQRPQAGAGGLVRRVRGP